MDEAYIKQTIDEVLQHTGCTISEYVFTEEGGIYWCSLSTPDSRFFIGKDGETLRSFNHLVRKLVEKKFGETVSAALFIDINGYQKKYFDGIRTTAHMLAERARYFKSTIEAEPMPAFERRIMHMFLENAKDIQTESKGEGKDRRLTIKYVGDII